MVTLFTVDAFTDVPFRGNPAKVCLLDVDGIPEDWMQSLAAECSLPETAFVFVSDGQLRIRWFTPVTEVDLCGHATLAAAAVLTGHSAGREFCQRFESADGIPRANENRIVFHAEKGTLTADCGAEGITLDFPATPVTPEDPPEIITELLRVDRDQVEVFGQTEFDWFVRLDSARAVKKLKPDFLRLSRLSCRGIMVTALGDQPHHDFVSRFFAPQSGIREDHVTGSAHCALGPYWQTEFGRHVLFAEQLSPRGGRLRVECQDDRVLLTGRHVIVSQGALTEACLPNAAGTP